MFGMGHSSSGDAWKFEIDYIMVTFNSRHPSDGRDRSLGDIHDEEEYDQSLKMIFISSNFTDEIQNHYDS